MNELRNIPIQLHFGTLLRHLTSKAQAVDGTLPGPTLAHRDLCLVTNDRHAVTSLKLA